MICPDCQNGTRVHKVEGKLRLRECRSCKKRFRTEEVLLHEVGAVTKERLLSFLAERKRWMSYRGLAHYFAVSETTIATHIKKLEGEGLVICKIENGSKLWQLADKPVEPPKPKSKPKAKVAVPVSGRVVRHQIAQPGEAGATPKSRTKTKPIQPQSWFSVIG